MADQRIRKLVMLAEAAYTGVPDQETQIEKAVEELINDRELFEAMWEIHIEPIMSKEDFKKHFPHLPEHNEEPSNG